MGILSTANKKATKDTVDANRSFVPTIKIIHATSKIGTEKEYGQWFDDKNILGDEINIVPLNIRAKVTSHEQGSNDTIAKVIQPIVTDEDVLFKDPKIDKFITRAEEDDLKTKDNIEILCWVEEVQGFRVVELKPSGLEVMDKIDELLNESTTINLKTEAIKGKSFTYYIPDPSASLVKVDYPEDAYEVAKKIFLLQNK